MPIFNLFNVLRRQSQGHLCKFEANLVYIASSRIAMATERGPINNNNSNRSKKNKQDRKTNVDGSIGFVPQRKVCF